MKSILMMLALWLYGDDLRKLDDQSFAVRKAAQARLRSAGWLADYALDTPRASAEARSACRRLGLLRLHDRYERAGEEIGWSGDYPSCVFYAATVWAYPTTGYTTVGRRPDGRYVVYGYPPNDTTQRLFQWAEARGLGPPGDMEWQRKVTERFAAYLVVEWSVPTWLVRYWLRQMAICEWVCYEFPGGIDSWLGQLLLRPRVWREMPK